MADGKVYAMSNDEGKRLDKKPLTKSGLMQSSRRLSVQQMVNTNMNNNEDGELTPRGIMHSLTMAADQRRQNKFMFKVTSLAIFALVVSILSNALLMRHIVENSKESHVQDGILVGRTNDADIVQTAQAHAQMPLFVAPVLPKHLKLDTLTVSYAAGVDDDTMIKETFTVGSTRWINDTYVTIAKSQDESPRGVAEVRVWNGIASVALKDGTEQPICHGDVDCAALKVAGQAEADALEKKALDALVENGFVDDDDREHFLGKPSHEGHGRSLLFNYGCCSTNVFYIAGLASDTRKCQYDGILNTYHRSGDDLSEACLTHDICISEANKLTNNRCGVRAQCDIDLAAAARSASNYKWWAWCIKKSISTFMANAPNGKSDGCS